MANISVKNIPAEGMAEERAEGDVQQRQINHKIIWECLQVIAENQTIIVDKINELDDRVTALEP